MDYMKWSHRWFSQTLYGCTYLKSRHNPISKCSNIQKQCGRVRFHFSPMLVIFILSLITFVRGNIFKNILSERVHTYLRDQYRNDPTKCECMIEYFRLINIWEKFYSEDILGEQRQLVRDLRPYIEDADSSTGKMILFLCENDITFEVLSFGFRMYGCCLLWKYMGYWSSGIGSSFRCCIRSVYVKSTSSQKEKIKQKCQQIHSTIEISKAETVAVLSIDQLSKLRVGKLREYGVHSVFS